MPPLDAFASSRDHRRIALQPSSLAHRIAELALERKALDVVVIDVQGRASYTDFLVIASGTSDRHVQAIADFVGSELKKADGVKSMGEEGLREGQWALVDFGSAVLHVFHQFTREVYDLQEIWKGAPQERIEPTAGVSVSQ